MGCGMTKEKLQTEILVLQLEKAEIQEQREKLIHQLEIINRHTRVSTRCNTSNSSNSNKAK